MRKLVNWRVIVALLTGTLLIVASHYVLDPTPPGHTGPVSLLRTVLHEVGFALIVALVIWGIFEYFSNMEAEEEWNKRIESVAKSVFFGVFRRNFPDALIQEANVLLLEQSFVRLGLHVTYTLQDDTVQDIDGSQLSFVRMSAVTRFRIRNVANSPAECPIAIMLPNPMHDGMKKKCGVQRVIVRKNGQPVPLDIARAETKYREALADNNNHQVPYRLDPVRIEPAEEIEVIWDYTMAKEDEDTEIAQTLFPADSVIITVMDTNPRKRTVRARSIHPAPLENDTAAEANGTYIFRLERYLLPNQGYAIWWKRDTSIPRAQADRIEPSRPEISGLSASANGERNGAGPAGVKEGENMPAGAD